MRQAWRGARFAARIAITGSRTREVSQGLRILLSADARAAWRSGLDGPFYHARYPDVARARIPPSVHYLLMGFTEGRDPSPTFSGRGYLDANPDVKATGGNPLAHYALHGAREGRPRVAPPPAPLAPSPDPTVASSVGPLPLRPRAPWPAELPLVTAVIVEPGPAGDADPTLRSIRGQTWPGLETIVVLARGGEEDRAIDGAEVGDPRVVRLVAPPGVRSRTELLDLGIARARGRYVVLPGRGTTLGPTAVEIALFAAEALGWDAVLELEEPSVDDAIGPPPAPGEVRRGSSVRVAPLFRRSALVEIGGCRALGSPPAGSEERELAGWLGRAGYRIWTLGGPQGPGGDSRPPGPWPRDAADDLAARSLVESARGDRPGGAILVATSGEVRGDAGAFIADVVRSLGALPRRVVVVRAGGVAWRDRDVRRLAADTPHIHDLVGVFPDAAARRAFMDHLVACHGVETLLVVGTDALGEPLAAAASRWPGVAIVELVNPYEDPIRSGEQAQPVDLVVAPSEESRRRFVDRNEERWSRTRVIAVPRRGREPGSRLIRSPAGAGSPVVGFAPLEAADVEPFTVMAMVRRSSDHSDARFVVPSATLVVSLMAGMEDRLRERCIAIERDAGTSAVVGLVDILVILSVDPAVTTVAREAMRSGKAIVAPAEGELAALIEDGRTGFVCRSGDVDGYVARIRQLLADPGLLQQMGDAARGPLASAEADDRIRQQWMDALDAAGDLAARRAAAASAR